MLSDENAPNPQERDPRSYAVIGAAMEVHRELGCGFLEPAYHEALIHELDLRQIPFQHERELPIHYKGFRLLTVYRADFVCFESIIVELKCLPKLTGREESQLINYLKASGLEVGLLIHFGNSSLEFKRFVRTRS